MLTGMVAIVGRPNVGKSTIFNRMTRSDSAIVDDQPGVTRDRLAGTVWVDQEAGEGFILVDTGGFETDDFQFQPFSENIVWQNTSYAIEEADVVLLVLDGKHGMHQHDAELLRHLENINKPYIAVVNKIDGMEHQGAAWEFFGLGLGEINCISAAHNRGVGDLKVSLAEKLSESIDLTSHKDTTEGRRIAIIGRPNAGKSSLLNRLVGEERALVSDVAGTTRDAIDTPLTYNKEKYVLVDTAGMRRKSKIHERIESLSVIRSLRAIDRADIIFLVVDPIEGVTDQDARLAEHATRRYKPVVFVVNKWDLVPDKDSHSIREFTEDLREKFKTLSYCPVMFISCLTNQRVHKLMEMAEAMSAVYKKRIPTREVNLLLQRMVMEHTPALIRNHTKRVKFYFATQVAAEPPTIVVFCNVAKEIQEAYKRYMKKRFRKELGFDGIPIKVIYRAKQEIRKRDQEEADQLLEANS
jgi:GTP-binding protein